MKIKICGMTDEAAIAAAVEAGADALGFVFAESPRRVSAEEARQLTEGLPQSVAKVAVMRHPSLADLREILEIFNPDCMQSDADDFKDLEVRSGPHLVPVYREGVCEPGLFVRREETAAGFRPDFVYEGPQSGQGEAVDWNTAARFARRGRMLLAGGLTADNVGEAIRVTRPWGVDVSSGVESERGKKSPAMISAFVAAARAAAAEALEEIEE